MAITALPLIAFSAYDIYGRYTSVYTEAEGVALRLADLQAKRISQVLEQAQRLAGALAERPWIRAMDPQHCAPLLAELRVTLPPLTDVSVVDSTGASVCSTVAPPTPLARPAFERALDGRASLSGPVAGAPAGSQTVAAAQPVRSHAGAVIGVVAVTTGLAQLTPFVAADTPVYRPMTTVIDENGTIVARSRDAHPWIGARLAMPIETATAAAQLFRGAGVDGIERLYAATPINGQGWRALVGLPTAPLAAESHRRVAAEAALLAGLIALASAGTALVAHRLLAPLNALVTELRRVPDEVAEVRLPPAAPRELEALVASLNGALAAERRTRARLTEIFEYALDGIVTADREGRVVDFNVAAERMFGYGRSDVMGRRVADLIVPPSLRAAHERGFARYLETGEPHALHKPMEVTALRADGSTFPVEINVTRSGTGESIQFTAFLRDITQRRNAIGAVHAQRELLASAQRIAKLGYWELDLASRRLTWSDQVFEIFGQTPATFGATEQAFLDCIHPDDRAAVLEAQRAVLAGERPLDTEHRIVLPDGSVKNVHERGELVRDAEGTALVLRGTCIDVTERKRLEEALHTRVRQLRKLSRRLIEVEQTERQAINRELHDRVGQGLTALKLILASLRTAPEHAVAHSVEEALLLTQSTIETVRDVMVDLRPSSLDDFGLVAALREYGEVFANRSGIAVQVNGDDVEPRLPLPVESAVFRIVQEALTNVLKHAAASRVAISLAEEAGSLVLRITDDGKGFRVGDDTARGSWGLRTMRERAETVGATLHIDSDVEHGTRLTLSVMREPPP
ncbi:MAG TPA: PAS domain S-box protein [Gammaproteobacteria bacterium]|nr:PAS domain S-box protein [Gammaproteobacteria bacterium]